MIISGWFFFISRVIAGGVGWTIEKQKKSKGFSFALFHFFLYSRLKKQTHQRRGTNSIEDPN